MQYTEVKNPRWANEEHTVINCEVNFTGVPEEFVPFSAVAQGDYPHTHEIYARCLAEEFGPVAEYVAPVIPEPVPEPVPTKEELMAKILDLKAQIEALGV